MPPEHVFEDKLNAEICDRQNRKTAQGPAHCGSSAPAETLLREYGFTVDNVCARARALLEAGKIE